MFTRLLNKLFNKTPKTASNLYYFEDSRKVSTLDDEHKCQGVETQPKPISYRSFEDEYQQAFYDYLLGASPSQALTNNDELTDYITEKIQALLKQPKLILAALPILPASLTAIIAQLDNANFDTDELINLIQQEPVIAAKVIELANSSYYNRQQKAITELKSAFMLLGAKGLVEGVINGFISKMVPQSNVYFRQYGEKIWQHSLLTGINAKSIVQQSPLQGSAAQAYFIGLISHLGDLIIYQLMLGAFAIVHPDCQPNAASFKDMMAKNSKKLTYLIAKYWQFPPAILEVLALQAKMKKAALLPTLYKNRPLACYLYEANIISELQSRQKQFPLESQTIDDVANNLLFSEEAKLLLSQLLASTSLAKA
ncbi:HDOD domain-containing protein [Colwellia chukchiensis]|nr:HDOD domain-containing protein [Colwellia chukchiensis]